MYWTLELASKLEDAPWPATKDELIDFAIRSGAPLEVIENLQEMEDEGEIYESIEDIWPDYPSRMISSLTRTSISQRLSLGRCRFCYDRACIFFALFIQWIEVVLINWFFQNSPDEPIQFGIFGF